MSAPTHKRKVFPTPQIDLTSVPQASSSNINNNNNNNENSKSKKKSTPTNPRPGLKAYQVIPDSHFDQSLFAQPTSDSDDDDDDDDQEEEQQHTAPSDDETDATMHKAKAQAMPTARFINPGEVVIDSIHDDYRNKSGAELFQQYRDAINNEEHDSQEDEDDINRRHHGVLERENLVQQVLKDKIVEFVRAVCSFRRVPTSNGVRIYLNKQFPGSTIFKGLIDVDVDIYNYARSALVTIKNRVPNLAAINDINVFIYSDNVTVFDLFAQLTAIEFKKWDYLTPVRSTYETMDQKIAHRREMIVQRLKSFRWDPYSQQFIDDADSSSGGPINSVFSLMGPSMNFGERGPYGGLVNNGPPPIPSATMGAQQQQQVNASANASNIRLVSDPVNSRNRNHNETYPKTPSGIKFPKYLSS